MNEQPLNMNDLVSHFEGATASVSWPPESLPERRALHSLGRPRTYA